MHAKQHDVVVEKTARYFTIGPDAPVGRIWALHGYGQLPEYFLRRFTAAAEAGWQVVAPEGLHRFYVEGTSGRVGASWMTREAREHDMADCLRFLDQIHAQLPPAQFPEVLLGFSQGVATGARWACRGRCEFAAHIFWAGVFPPDLDLATEVARLTKAPLYFALGDTDPYFTESLVAATSAALDAAAVPHEWVRFQGGHSVDSEALGALLRRIA